MALSLSNNHAVQYVMLEDQSYLLIPFLFMSMGITNNLSYRDVIVEEGHDYL